ncbi:hypothetical protein [Conyzicola sp.]|uniref:hypothetical protein n=1 Tax=Conyzicola sp. TaxID=1969404 RepID=UPI0039897635
MPFIFSEAEIRRAAGLLLQELEATAGESVGDIASDLAKGMWTPEGTDDPAAWDSWNTILAQTRGLRLIASDSAADSKVFEDDGGQSSRWLVGNGHDARLLEGRDPFGGEQAGGLSEAVGMDILRDFLDDAMRARPTARVSDLVEDLLDANTENHRWSASVARILFSEGV